MIDTHGTIDSVLDHHLGGMDLILNLIELPVISYGKVISQSSLCLNASDCIQVQSLR